MLNALCPINMYVRAISVVPGCLLGWMPLSWKCKKIRRGWTGRILLEKEETFLAVLPRVSGNKGALFLCVASRPAINNILSILSTAEIECHEKGCSREQMRAQTGVFLWKRKGMPDRRYYLSKLGNDATISAQRRHRERPEICHCWILYTADIRHPLSWQHHSRTHDARLLLTALSGRQSGQEWNAQFACLAPKHASEIFSPWKYFASFHPGAFWNRIITKKNFSCPIYLLYYTIWYCDSPRNYDLLQNLPFSVSGKSFNKHDRESDRSDQIDARRTWVWWV